MAPHRLLGLAALALHAAAAPDTGRRAMGWPSWLGHIWGSCDGSKGTTEDGLGCHLANERKCNHLLSDGPEDADVEVVVGNLPPSMVASKVHLQWWAPYESTSEYDPLEGLHNVSIYKGWHKAFPKYDEPEFNGGNVLVNESGVATIRVRSPAIYWQFPNHVTPVHVYMRVCIGEDIMKHPDTMLFDVQTGEPRVVTKSQDTRVEVMRARPYASSSGSTVEYDIPEPWAKVTDVWHNEDVATISTTGGPEPMELSDVINSAKEALDMDALMFSPVYSCFLKDQFYSHYKDDCVDSCDSSESVAEGQCVRAETLPRAADFHAEWQLTVRCSSLCGADATNETLHRVRLNVAGLLDVPFQEVTEVAVYWPFKEAGRRLIPSPRRNERELVLQVSVSSKRISSSEGLKLLKNLMPDKRAAAQLLYLHVLNVDPLTPILFGSVTDRNGKVGSMGAGTDPYEASYEYVQPEASESKDTKAGGAHVAIIIGASVIAVLLGAVCGAFIFRRHQRAKSARETVEGKVVDPWDAAVPDVPPTEIGQPEPEENTTGAGVL